MQRILLLDVPNQEFEFTTDLCRFEISLRQMTDTLMLSSCTRRINAYGEIEVLFTGFPVAARQPIIPFKYMVSEYGNFYFITPDDEIPYYTRFNSDHLLYHLSNSELEYLNG